MIQNTQPAEDNLRRHRSSKFFEDDTDVRGNDGDDLPPDENHLKRLKSGSTTLVNAGRQRAWFQLIMMP